jgi:hypothetical protein
MAGGFGRPSAGVINVMRGVNHRGAGNIVAANTDNQGLTFFTKPNLNLSYDNVKAVRRLNFLCDGDDRSMGSAIRCLLSPQVIDPRIADRSYPRGAWGPSALPIDPVAVRSAIVDDYYPFITPLTNTLMSLSGWPDFVHDTWVSKEGRRKEVTFMIDSCSDIYGQYDLTANFQNVDGNPILALFAVWCDYMGRVATGELNPYPQCIVEREIDYNSRIYRLVLDPTQQFVRHIAEACLTAPTAVPTGAQFTFNQDDFFTPEAAQIGIRFQCVGARYNDPISIYNFNKIVETFNGGMQDGRRESEMVKLTPPLRKLFTYDPQYPRISNTNELEWWMRRSEFDKLMTEVRQYLDIPADSDFNNFTYT